MSSRLSSEPVEGGDALRMRLLGVRRLSDPEQAVGKLRRIERPQGQTSQRGHEGLMREPMATEQIAQPLRLIVRRSKDRGAHRAMLGLADEQAREQEAETVKDLGSHQRAQRKDEGNEFCW